MREVSSGKHPAKVRLTGRVRLVEPQASATA
jgi:hypothetical protein